jgi:hypothetical protein
MATRLFGVETEYALTTLTPDREFVEPRKVLTRLMHKARTMFPALPDAHSAGVFLGNGSRLYIDCGQHLELSTPECADPWDIVRYIRAGDDILTLLVLELEKENPDQEQILLRKGNVDYSGTKSTWGCHESYMHQANPAILPNQLIPHLVSRLIYTGAGGFDSRSLGLSFTLSPRVAHLKQPVSDASTSCRGIFHTKNESLSKNGYHRLHLLCGESLCSERATWLKIGITALIVAAIEGGGRPGDTVQLKDPLASMHQFAMDPTGKVTTESAQGIPLTALDIQHHYLEQTERHLDDPCMPPWGQKVCQEWRKILNTLKKAPESVQHTLDWSMKLALYQNRAQQHGVTWSSLPHWTRAIELLNREHFQDNDTQPNLDLATLLRQDDPCAEVVKKLTPILTAEGLKWEGLQPFLNLRHELFEIDTRFAQVGKTGIFAMLDQQNVLMHHMPGVDRLTQATQHPPSVGRAKIRGTCIHQLANNPRQYTCDWTGIVDRKNKRRLNLEDPLATQECWESLPADQPEDDGDDFFSTFTHAQNPEIGELRERIASRLSQYGETRQSR